MSRRLRCYSVFSAWIFFTGVFATQTAVSAANPPPGLSRKVAESIVRDVLPAVQMGDSYRLINSLSRLTARMPDKQIEAVDLWLEELNVPKVGELLARARLNLVYQNGGRGLPKPSSRELLLTVGAIRDQVSEILRQKDDHPAMANPLPSPERIQDYKELFWKIHVYDNRLMSAAKTANYAQTLAKNARINRRTLNPTEVEILETDFSQQAARIAALRRELEEREAALRIQRLVLAGQQLQGSTQELTDQLLAVNVLQVDGQILADFFKAQNRSGGSFKLESLRDVNWQDVQAQAQQALDSADQSLKEKSQLLFAGLHWWLRGRYGAGPDGGGLLKSQLAMKSPQAQFALFMPAQTPIPTDPQKGGRQVPQVDRRHHYIWAWEDRSIQSRQQKTYTESFQADITTQRFY